MQNGLDDNVRIKANEIRSKENERVIGKIEQWQLEMAERISTLEAVRKEKKSYTRLEGILYPALVSLFVSIAVAVVTSLIN
jgi:hypothetical protein